MIVLILIGRPSDLHDVQDEDWAPTLKLGHSIQQITTSNNGIQQQTNMENNNNKQQETYNNEQQQITTDIDSRPQQQSTTRTSNYSGEILQQESAEIVTLALSPTESEATLSLIGEVVISDHELPTFDINNEISCQTDLTMENINGIEEDDRKLKSELYELRSKALNSKLIEQSFKDNEEKTIYYTGLPNFLVLMQVFHLCENYIFTTSLTMLGKFEQFILVLMRLHLNLPLKDLAYRFGILQPTVSRIWHKWIDVLYKRTQFFIQWPERDLLQATMPMEFRKAFGTKVVVIIDCFELFIERPSNLLARAQTWSQYKHHNTVKFLIGIAPQGFVSYISTAWGGRASDKTIVEASGILKKLLPGDVVIADRGFNVEDSVGLYAASLKIPAFTRGKLQLSVCAYTLKG